VAFVFRLVHQGEDAADDFEVAYRTRGGHASTRHGTPGVSRQPPIPTPRAV
jgi:hypothetical protein